MDAAMMDPELASEMVKLLAQELKVVRAQLREAERGASSTPSTGDPSNRLTRERVQALVTENEALRMNNTALQERISRLQDQLAQVSSIKSENGIPNPFQYEEVAMPKLPLVDLGRLIRFSFSSMSRMREELAGLLAEREDLVREKEDALRYQEKHSTLREKYKQAKAKAHEYDEELNELRVELSNCKQELEQVKKGVVTEIDFREFLRDTPYEPVEGQVELASLQPYSRSVRSKFHKDLTDLCQGPYFVNTHEVIWSPAGIALGLVIKPTFQYNAKLNGGTWTKLEEDFDVGKQMDVCLLTGKAWCYLGTYERVEESAMAIAPDTLQYLSREKMDYASKRTTLFPDLVPPSQTQMIKNMYKKGVIKLQCIAMRCVAFNETFSEGLRNMCASMPSAQNDPQSSSAIPTSSVNNKKARKRKRNPESTEHSTRNKKRKH